MNRKIKLEDFHKLESSSVLSQASNPSQMLQAIIKVKSPDYVPRGVTVRANISPHLLTADFRQGDLSALERDPEVESISISKPLNME